MEFANNFNRINNFHYTTLSEKEEKVVPKITRPTITDLERITGKLSKTIWPSTETTATIWTPAKEWRNII